MFKRKTCLTNKVRVEETHWWSALREQVGERESGEGVEF